MRATTCRCRACVAKQGKHRRSRSFSYRYKIISGAAVFSGLLESLKRAGVVLNQCERAYPHFADEMEIERVRVFEHGQNYEVVRNGRWVDWWEGLYGIHRDPPGGETGGV